MANLYTDGHGNHPGAGRSTTPLQAIDKRRPLRVLSEADWQHWTRKGYVIVRNAVSAAEADAVVEMLWRFQEMDPHDPTTWYRPQLREHRMTELNNTGMVEVYNHQSLWDTRQNRRVYDAFVDIWDREDLWVAIDRANLNPPNKAARAAGRKDGFIHFDVDVSRRPLPIAAQGVLSLARRMRRSAASSACRGSSRRSSSGGHASPRAPTRSSRISASTASRTSAWRKATC